MNTPSRTLALVIDADNPPFKYTEQIIQFCKNYGTLRIKNAYGDWDQPPLSSHRQTMTKLGVHCVQQKRDRKNATDRKLKREVDSMLEKREVDTYIIVSGDGHFASIYEQVRQTGATVIFIGSEKSTSKKLLKLRDILVFVETLIKNQITEKNLLLPNLNQTHIEQGEHRQRTPE